MAPTRSKKRKSTESAVSVDIQNFPQPPPQMIPTKMRSPQGTPTNRSPIRKHKTGITVAQKQALIDNLQLEITERARKLRAQYMLQAQGMRSRIEIRVNRIPTALRKVKMGDLLGNHSQPRKQAVAGPSRTEKIRSPHKNAIHGEHGIRANPSPQRGVKRLSDEISVDKENEYVENPKKRIRGQAPMPPARTTSKINPSQVLSPRSANSRTYPQAPVRPISPQKSFLARPISPLKPTAPVPSGGATSILTNMVEKAKSTRSAASRKVTGAKETATSTIGAGRGRRAVATQPTQPAQAARPTVGKGRPSTNSDSSEASASTVVRKPVAAPLKKAPVKKTVMGTIKGMGSQKKIPAATKATASATGGRVLRKRN